MRKYVHKFDSLDEMCGYNLTKTSTEEIETLDSLQIKINIKNLHAKKITCIGGFTAEVTKHLILYRFLKIS